MRFDAAGPDVSVFTDILASLWPLVATIRISLPRNSQSTPLRIGLLSSLDTAKDVLRMSDRRSAPEVVHA